MNEATNYAYISFSRDVADFVDRLASDLMSAGCPVRRSIDLIEPGQNWQPTIAKAIQKCSAVLYVTGSSSDATLWQEVELKIALRTTIPIFVVVIHPTKMPLMLFDMIMRGSELVTDFNFWEDYDIALNNLIAELPQNLLQGHPIEFEAPKSKGYVFISYAEEDTAFVTKLREFLKTRSYGYWDYQDSERDYHNFLFLELEEVIKNAAATISVMSPDWKRSKWAAKEFLYSEEVKTPIFLLKVQEMEPTLVTVGIPYIDFTRDEPKGFEKLDNELRRKGLI